MGFFELHDKMQIKIQQLAVYLNLDIAYMKKKREGGKLT